ncbi:hypothetical protein PYW07_013988 [Mythimna separata]|uniref:Uncharacterized protein n=1 Tax=Mythimna separata TaxID=271217 RepID=A0AAD7YFT1_MYTSE|nr:hypothetical protein PYW07_013988 [Mythimna separata]
MPLWETSFDNSDRNAAQTLMELQSNIVKINEENVLGHNITVTAGVVAARTAPKKRFLNRYTSSTRETRNVETQTEDDYSKENTLQLAVTERDQTIEQLRKDLAYYKRLTDTVGENHETPDDEVDMVN